MTNLTFFIAGALIVTGLGGYGLASPAPGADHVSWTALIPAIFGAVLAIFAWLGRNPAWHKHAMHVSMTVALMGLVGAGVRIPKLLQTGSSLTLGCHLVMAGLCVILLFFGIRSFAKARLLAKPPAP